MDKKYRRFFLALAAACAAVALLCACGLLRRQRVFADLAHTSIAFDGGSRARTAQDGYGAMSAGPGLTLPAGEYTIRIRYDGDGDNSLRLSSLNGARIEPAEIALPAGQGSVEAVFTIVEAAHKLQTVFSFDAGTRFEVLDVRLYSPFYRDPLFAAVALLAAVFGVWLLALRGWLTPERRGALAVLGLSVLIASAPALKDAIGVGHDTQYHLVRMANLADALAHGQFPARVGGFSHNGYGAMISVFYPDAFLYPFALLMNAGASMQFALNSLLVAVNAVSAWAMYAAARRMFAGREMAVCAGVLYTLSIYRVYDVYTRCAVGEMLAMAFMPVFLLGLYEVLLGDARRWPVLSLGASAIFLSHLLSTVICAALALGACLLFIVRIARERRLLPLVKAGALAAALCAFQLVPLAMAGSGGMGMAGMERALTYFDLQPAQLFLDHMAVDIWDVHEIQFTAEIGLPLLLAAALTVCTVAVDGVERRGRLALLLLGAGALFAWASTNLFPWSYVSVATGGLSDYLQFPWRMLMMTAAFLALAGGYGMVRFAGEHARPMLALALAVGAVTVLPTLTQEARTTDIIDFGEIASPHLLSGEYLPEGADYMKTTDTSVLTTGDAQLTAYDKDGTTITARASSEAGGTVAFPLFYFDGYRAALDGQALAVYPGENHRVTLDIPAGAQGELRVWYAPNALWRAADAVSLATALALCIRGVRRRRAGRRAQAV